MPPLAYFGIESHAFSTVIDLLILFAVILDCALVYWTYADARRRVVDPVMVGLATAIAVVVPFLGPLVYLILRPPDFLEDVHQRELETRAAEARLYELDYGLCPHCDYRVERDFIRCPSCLRKLKERCVSCSRPLDRTWTICPYCETEVPESSRSRRTRRRGGADGETASGAGRAADESPMSAESRPSDESRLSREGRAAGESFASGEGRAPRPARPPRPARRALAAPTAGEDLPAPSSFRDDLSAPTSSFDEELSPSPASLGDELSPPRSTS